MINILLVDDQTLLCEVLKTWLDVEQDIQVLGVAHDGHQALEEVEKLQPDIVLMDIDMPQMDGLKATEIISQRFPKVKVIVLSGHDDDVYLGKSLRAGAKGYLLKNTAADELVEKIRSVYNNVNLLAPETGDRPISLESELEELIETYRLKFESIVEEYERNAIAPEQLELIKQKLEQELKRLENKINKNQIERIKELETKNQSSWRSIRKELVEVNNQFDGANRNLSAQFDRQIKNLRQDMDSKLSSALDDWSRQRAALQEWAVQRDEMRPSVEDYETKNRQELISVINPIRASFGDIDKQLQTMRNWLIAMGVLTLLSLGVAGYLLADRAKSSETLIIPEQDLLD